MDENQHRRGDEGKQEQIEFLRGKIEELSPEFRLLGRYIDAHAELHSEQTRELLRAFQASKMALGVLKWVASIGFSIAGIWAVFTGKSHS